MSASSRNLHCCVVYIDGWGVLLRGPSGSGKSSLLFGLIESAGVRGLDADLITDDQALVTVEGLTLYASAPKAIAGKVELRGFGMVEMGYRERTQIHLICDLVPDEQVERFPEPKTETILGVEVRSIFVPENHEQHAVRIVLAYLNQFVR